MPHVIYIVFLFAFGSCVGSFLNVVVWRLPQLKPVDNEGFFRGYWRAMYALSDPPSHCPKCNKLLKWYDNLPVVGWFKLGGKCRFCKEPFSIRYPIVEAVTGLMFVGYYVAFFIYQMGPCVHDQGNGVEWHLFSIVIQWWQYGLYMFLLSGLLAASLIDAENFFIPMEIPWTIAVCGVAVHTIFDTPHAPGNLIVSPRFAAAALGAGLGLIISLTLLWTGVLSRSFAGGAPMLEVERDEHERLKEETKKQAKKSKKKSPEPGSTDSEMEAPPEWTKKQVRREMRHEMRFLMPPMVGALLFICAVLRFPTVESWWAGVVSYPHVGGFFGSLLGGLVGGMVVWLTRIFGTLLFGREAMGMGDIDLMVAVGAVLGAGNTTVAFFMAPFLGIGMAIYMLLSAIITGKPKHELPYGPYLSLAAAIVMLFSCSIGSVTTPYVDNVVWLLRQATGLGN